MGAYGNFPLYSICFSLFFNPLGFNRRTRGHLGGTGGPLGGTWGHMVTCISIQYVAQPFRVKPGDKGTFRGSGQPLGGTWGHMTSIATQLLEMDVTT